jgi:hypothetical protein
MVRRPDSIPEARRAMREALDRLNSKDKTTKCYQRPIPYEIRQSPDEAAEKCGRGTSDPCPVLEVCATFGFTESVYSDDMVYGGYIWKRGSPVLSEADYKPKPGPKPKVANITNGSLYS